MNIFYFVPYPPSLVRARSFNLIRGLAEHNHRVTVGTLTSSTAEREDVRRLESLGLNVWEYPITKWRSLWNSAIHLPTDVPLQAIFSWDHAVATDFGRRLSNPENSNKFDVVHVEHLRGVKYGLFWKKQHPNLPMVWDSVDSISYLFKQTAQQSKRFSNRLLSRLELPRTERYEARLPGYFERTIVTSPIDRDEFIHLAPDHNGDHIKVIGNGVDFEYFQPGDPDLREPFHLVFSGKMSYHANITMAHYLVEEILPRVWAKMPQVELWIVGKDPPPIVQALGSHPNVHITGTVPDMRGYLQKATAAIVPLTYGAGIQFKVLEAMACATPVIASPKATQALQIRPGKDLIVADTPDAYCDQVVRLMSDRDLQRKMGCAGRRYVETYHSWSQISHQLENVYFEAISNKSARIG